MLSFFKQAAKRAYDHQPSHPKTIRWSTVDITHTFECDTVLENPKPVKKTGKGNRKTFENAAEAIFYDRQKAQRELRGVYLRLLPDLENFKLSQKSLDELETIQNKLIDELDRLRKNSPDIENPNDSKRFSALERKLIIVMNAWQCTIQRNYVDGLLDSRMDQPPKQHIKRRRSVNFENEAKSGHCFAFIFCKNRDSKYTVEPETTNFLQHPNDRKESSKYIWTQP
jgi:hypothetical protein